MPRLAAIIFRWTVTVMAVVMVAGAVASGWCTHGLAYVRYTTAAAPATPWTFMRYVIVSVDRGCYEYTSTRDPGAIGGGPFPGWHFEDLNAYSGDPVPRWHWLRFDWTTTMDASATYRQFTAVIPTWAPALLLLALTAAAWRGPLRRRSRRRAGRCVQCNYDRRGGLPEAATSQAVCPECGAVGGDRALAAPAREHANAADAAHELAE